jgi:hypothetical protein
MSFADVFYALTFLFLLLLFVLPIMKKVEPSAEPAPGH